MFSISQRFARQGQVDRPPRLAHRQVERPVDGGLQHVAAFQLIIPLDEFAHHVALVEHLLRPVNLAISFAVLVAGLGERGAARGEDHRQVPLGRVDQAAHGVGRADIDMHHDHLRPAGDHVVAQRHVDGDVLMRHQHRRRRRRAEGGGLGEGFDDRREIGAGIAEEIVHPAVRQQRQIGVRDRAVPDALHRHADVSP